MGVFRSAGGEWYKGAGWEPERARARRRASRQPNCSSCSVHSRHPPSHRARRFTHPKLVAHPPTHPPALHTHPPALVFNASCSADSGAVPRITATAMPTWHRWSTGDAGWLRFAASQATSNPGASSQAVDTQQGGSHMPTMQRITPSSLPHPHTTRLKSTHHLADLVQHEALPNDHQPHPALPRNLKHAGAAAAGWGGGVACDANHQMHRWLGQQTARWAAAAASTPR